MLINEKGNNYIIADDEGRNQTKLNKKKTDAAVKKLGDAFSTISQTMQKLYDEDTELYYFIISRINDSLDFDEGKSWKLNDILFDLRATDAALKTQRDEIPDPENIMTLEDYGFKADRVDIRRGDTTVYEKRISDNDDTEVVEEIVVFKDGAIRRLRTIEWEKTD
ncbi:MAG: hypothetical protein II399_04325, partial [Lachnospiraceae bacterium]|nr:hypothetical protein [Lachnospiraceae bacterium]